MEVILPTFIPPPTPHPHVKKRACLEWLASLQAAGVRPAQPIGATTYLEAK